MQRVVSPDENFVRMYVLAKQEPSRFKVRFYEGKNRKHYAAIKDLHLNVLMSRIDLDVPHSMAVVAILDNLKETPAANPLTTEPAAIMVMGIPEVTRKLELIQPVPAPVVKQPLPAVLQAVAKPAPPAVKQALPAVLQAVAKPAPAKDVRLVVKQLGAGIFGQADLVGTGADAHVEKIGEISRFELLVLPYLKNPNIVRAWSDGQIHRLTSPPEPPSKLFKEHKGAINTFILNMEVVPGEKFFELPDTALPAARAGQILRFWYEQWRNVMAYMRELRIRHNDLHQNNFMVNTTDYTFKIIDWGGGSVMQEFGPTNIVITPEEVLNDQGQVPRLDSCFVNYYFYKMASRANIFPKPMANFLLNTTSQIMVNSGYLPISSYAVSQRPKRLQSRKIYNDNVALLLKFHHDLKPEMRKINDYHTFELPVLLPSN